MERPYEGRDPYIFVSYAHADKDVVYPIIGKLQEAGYRVWYDAGIEAGQQWNAYIAQHIFSCQCLLAMITSSFVASKHCVGETHFAYEKDRDMLFVRLEDVELPLEMQMEYGLYQHVIKSDYTSDDAFFGKLFEANILTPCLDERIVHNNEILLQVESVAARPDASESELWLALGKVQALQSSDPRVEELAMELDERLHPADTERKRSETEYEVQVGEVAEGAAVDSMPRSNMAGAQEALRSSAVEEGRVFTVAGDLFVTARKGIDEYSWAELKRIADMIATAGTDAEGLEIAKRFRLVDLKGRLEGDTIPVTLADGTQAAVRIAGFRHDELADDSDRKAGITFEFADSPTAHVMNSRPSGLPIWLGGVEASNSGGWERSEMRRWLNGEFRSLLPGDLSSNIAVVRKPTNNAGYVARAGDTSVVTATDDALWLLSLCEVYGKRIAFSDGNEIYSLSTYNAEGTQYQLYKDKDVSTSSYAFCAKGGAHSVWWLRSPIARDSNVFHFVNPDGDWDNAGADLEWGVSPGFCF